jgi:hypothetical protein
MKRFRIHTTTAAVLALMTAGSFAAPKKKTAGDTAKGIIDALLGDDKQPAPAQGKAGAGLAGTVAQFSGKWNIEDRSGAVTVKAAGTAAQVHWDFAKGGGDDGVGIERGGKFYIGYGGVAGPGILVFQMAGGKLTGVGAASKGGVPAAFTETLTGPAGLNGQYMSSRGEKVGIAPAANDSYLVIWTKTKRAGFGKKIGNELVVAFDDRDVANANLVVYSPGANKLDGVFWTTLGKEGGNENLLRPAGVPFAIAGRPRVDRFGNVIPDGPPPAGLEKPIDLPVAPIAPAVPAVGIPGPAAPVVGGIGVQFPKEWTNTQNGRTVTSVSPDGSARVIITTVTGDGADGPWDDVQSKMAKHLAPHFPGLTDLAEVSTEHDVIRDGVGLRVVTYTAKFNGAAVDIVVDFARENNVDGKGLVLIIRCSEQGNAANQAAAKKTDESLRLKN